MEQRHLSTTESFVMSRMKHFKGGAYVPRINVHADRGRNRSASNRWRIHALHQPMKWIHLESCEGRGLLPLSSNLQEMTQPREVVSCIMRDQTQ